MQDVNGRDRPCCHAEGLIFEEVIITGYFFFLGVFFELGKNYRKLVAS